MSKRQQKDSQNQQLEMFHKRSRQVFGELYLSTSRYSILAAQYMLEDSVDKGLVSVENALAIFNNSGAFAKMLLEAENDYQTDNQNADRQKLHKRMAGIERSTHWAIAVGLGLTFLAAGPFASALLQPTADAVFKRKPAAAQAIAASQPQTPENVTNKVYNSYAHETESASDGKKHKVTLTCKNKTIDAYQMSLLELLQRGDVVTLEMNGKKLSLCYRPTVRRASRQRALSR